jgi:hypothetical protein
MFGLFILIKNNQIRTYIPWIKFVNTQFQTKYKTTTRIIDSDSLQKPSGKSKCWISIIARPRKIQARVLASGTFFSESPS